MAVSSLGTQRPLVTAWGLSFYGHKEMIAKGLEMREWFFVFTDRLGLFKTSLTARMPRMHLILIMYAHLYLGIA